MGVDHWFYLINSTKYFQFIRPIWKKRFNIMGYQYAIIKQEKRKLQDAGIVNQAISLITVPFYQYNPNPSKGPLQRYFQKNQKKSSKQQSLQLKQIENQFHKSYQYLKQNSIQVQGIRNHFLRTEDFLQTIDRHQISVNRYKVSNLYQVQNYIEYLQFVNKVTKNYSGQWENQYPDVDEALQKFRQIYETMKKQNRDILIFTTS